MNRSHFLKSSLACLAAFSFSESFASGLKGSELPNWNFVNLRSQIPEPIEISSVEMLKAQEKLFLVISSKSGVKGITQCNDRMQHLISLLNGLVLPNFIGKDARDLPELVDNAYRLNSNYKYAGMPLWNCIGSVEIACWDLLGKIIKKPVFQLLGKQIRSEYGVYISDFNREGDVEKISYSLKEKLQITGAKGVKIKVGGRMQNTIENKAQTQKFIPTLRKILGDKISIYADANGSFTPKEGIETGKLLEDYGVEIFEEPCNFEDEDGMRLVTKALKKIKMAGGEQDSSVYSFERLAKTNVYDILQPDVYYNGGILRTLQVAEIAKRHKKYIAPHTPKADPLIAPFWQVATHIDNLYGLQECVYNTNEPPQNWYTPAIKIVGGNIQIPTKEGLGIEYDIGIFKSAEKIN